MNKYGLKAKYTQRRHNQPYKKIEAKVKQNLVKAKFNVDTTNKIWTTNITYLIFEQKWAYL